MKKIISILSIIAAATTLFAEKKIGDGWYSTDVFSKGLVINASNIQPTAGTPISTPVPIGGTAKSVATYSTTNGVESNPDIVNLANMLDNDPNKIIEYVRDNIKNEIYYGVKKGPLMTLYEKSGNDYDKCVLVRTLLKAAGQDAHYYFHKSIDIVLVNRPSAASPIMSLADMYGITADLSTDANQEALLTKLFTTRIPFQLTTMGEYKVVLMPRYKIAKFVSGEGFSISELVGKKKTLNELYNVKEVAGVSGSSLLTSAGGTLNTSAGTVANLTEEPLKGTLKGYSAVLSNQLHNDLTKTAKELAGEVSNVSERYAYNMLLWMDGDPQNDIYITFEAFYNNTYANCIRMYNAANGDMGLSLAQGSKLIMTFYKEVPSFDYSYLKIYDGTSTTVLKSLKLAELQGDKLWVSFSGNTASVKLGSSTLFTKTVSGTSMTLTFGIQHGYDDLFYDNESYEAISNYREQADFIHKQEETFTKGNTYVYNIAYGYSDASALLSKRQGVYAEKLAAAKAVSGNFDSDGKFVLTNGALNDTQKDLLSEGLNVMGLTWLSQTYKADQMIAHTHGCFSQYAHRLGKIAQETGFYIDIKLQLTDVVSQTLDAAESIKAFRLSSMYSSAMEHGVIQQLQEGAEAISTINIFHYANEKKNPFIIIKNASQVESLSGYSTAEKNALKSVFTEDATSVILIPKNRSCVPTDWDWQGYGYIVFSDSRAGMMISGKLNGGYTAYSRYYNVQSTYNQVYSAPSYSIVNSHFSTYATISNYLPSFSTPKIFSWDPVNMFSGAYTYETKDVSAGDTLVFNRMYNSNLNESKDSGLGNGWKHNYDIKAIPRTAWEESLCGGTAEQGSSFILSVYSAKEVMGSVTDTTSDAEKAKAWATAALIAKWGVDGMLENSVSIQIGKEAMQFVKQYKNTGTETSPVYSEYFASPAGTNYKLEKNSNDKYVLTVPYAETMLFNADNNIESITDIFGKTTAFAYNSNKKLTTVTDPYSRTLNITWNGDKISGVSCMGKSVSFSYTNDNLTSATDTMSKVWNYEYDGNNRLTVLKNPNNGGSIVVKNIYSDNGAVTEQHSCGDTTKKWTLSYIGTRSEEKDPLGNIKKYYYDDRGFCIKQIDANGDATIYEYDAQGRETMREYPVVFKSSSSSSDESGNITVTANYTTSRIRSTYDNFHNKLSETTIEVPVTKTIQQISGKLGTSSTSYGTEVEKTKTLYTYEEPSDDSVPRLLSVTQKGLLEGESDRTQTINGYFTVGTTKTNLPTSITDERGVTTIYTYNDSGVLLSESIAGRTTSYSNFNNYNQPQTITYPDATTQTSTYNDLGDVLTTTDAAGLITAYTYDNKRRVTATAKSTTGSTDSITTSTVYDDADNVISQTDEDGLVTASTWTAQKKKLTDTVGTGANAQTTTYTYDLADRQISTILPDGKVESNTLDAVGNVLTTTVGNKTTTYTYDERGQVKTVKTPIGNTISYGYDVLGNKISMTDAKGKTVTYTYNSFGEQSTLTNRRNGTFRMSQNLVERKNSTTTPLGRVSTTNYAQGTWDVSSIVSPAGNTTTMAYDATTGKLTSSTDNEGTINYSYDEAGRLSEKTQTDADPIAYAYDSMGRIVASTELGGITTQYAYTSGGKLSAILYPGVNDVNAREVDYTYDNLGRLWKITDWANRVTTYTYDQGNRITRIDRPNGTYRELTYDSETGNLTGISEKKSDGSVIFSYGYVYDGDNRITQITRTPKQRAFKRNAYTATYDLDNKLQSFGSNVITYDNDGNMTSGPIIEGGSNSTLEFNSRGQLMGTGDVAYAYDLEGSRTVVMHYDKNKILTQYRYVYNRVGNVPEVLMRVKLTNMTSQSTYYIYGVGLEYEVKITPDGRESVRYYHYDQIGSTIAMTDSEQAITDRFHYDPWGYVLHSIGDSDTPFQFVGSYGIQTDPNGLINMRARYYNPVTKSFISQDPSGFDGGLNWYLYANGNPFTYIDQNGEFPIAPIIIAAGVGALAELFADLIRQYNSSASMPSFSVDWKSLGLSATKGAIVGAASAIITPASGTIAMGIGFRSTSYVARTTSIGLSAGVSGVTQVGYNYTSNEYLGTQNNLTSGILSSAIFGGFGQGVSSIIKTTGYSTILQTTKFNAVPKSIAGYGTTYNGRLLTSSWAISSSIGSIPSYK